MWALLCLCKSCDTFACACKCRPAVFKSSNSLDANRSPQGCTSHQEDDNEDYSSDDEDLPPLEANMNRIKPFELQSEEDSDSGSDTDP